MNTTLSANQRWFFFRILPEVSDPFSLGLTKRIVASGNEIENMDVQYQVKNRLYMPWTSKLVSVTFYIRLHGKVDRLFCHSQNFSDIHMTKFYYLRCSAACASAEINVFGRQNSPVQIKARALARFGVIFWKIKQTVFFHRNILTVNIPVLYHILKAFETSKYTQIYHFIYSKWLLFK